MSEKMAVIRSNAKEFVKRLDAVGVERHLDTMRGIAENLDNIRFQAVEKFMHPKARRKGNPPRPDKLTIRSGKLANILRSPGTWNIPRTKAEARLRADRHLLFWIRPQITKSKAEYLARLSVVPAGDREIEYRVRHETHGSKRGILRPFLRPAIDANTRHFEAVMFRYQREYTA